ncbi:hypothetical protein HanHA89_Chr01g0034831 [Helianthus annuus]|nr:hypothetical protein HanHA89_Chr01g0034831 [Helianthus annuus]
MCFIFYAISFNFIGIHIFLLLIMVVKVPTRLRVLPEYSLQGRLPRHEYSSPRPITPRVLPNTPEYLPSTPEIK